MRFSLPHAQGLTQLLQSGVRDPELLSLSKPIFDPRGRYQMPPSIAGDGQWLYGVYYGKKGLGQLTLRREIHKDYVQVRRIEYWGQLPERKGKIFDWFANGVVRSSVHLIATDCHGDTYEEDQKMGYYRFIYKATKGLRTAINAGILPGVILDEPPMRSPQQGTALYRIDSYDLPFADDERLHPLALMERWKALQKQQRVDARLRERETKHQRNRKLPEYLR